MGLEDENGIENTMTNDGEIEPKVDESPTEGNEAKATESVYEPNYQFKVLDQELEFDDRVKSIIKDKESEDYFRDLYTKAHGLDSYKSKLEAKSSELSEYQEKYQSVFSDYEKLRTGVEELGNLSQKDFTTFQKYMGISDQLILERAKQIISLKDRPESEQRQIEDLYNGRVDGFRTQHEMQALRQQNDQLMKRQHEFELNQAMSQSEIVSFKSEFDQRLGEGAFVKHVQNYGRNESALRNSYVAPLEAVMAVYNQYKPLFATPASTPQTQRNPPPKPPSNLGTGVNRTPTGRPIKSLDDLRKLAQELEAS